MSCLAHASYNMKADIYEFESSQDSNTGAIIKTWAKKETIACLAKGIVRDTLSAGANSVDLKNYLIAVNNIVKIRTSSPISSSYRVLNIRNSDGIIWKESDNINSEGGFEGSTIFEARGSTPILDFTGKVIEYEVMLQRQEIQKLEM